MPQKTNLNVNPYYEDFDANKNFYKVLFRPGYSIQGRELTQLQSILQNQIESFGKYSFKQGELVIPGEVGLNNKLDYVKLSSVSEVAVNDGLGNIVYRKYDISQLHGRQLRGLTSGVIGNVVSSKNATETNADTLFVVYTTSGNANNENTFRQGETLEVIDGINTPLMVVGTDGSVLPTAVTVVDPDTGAESSIVSPAMGFSSAVKVEEGIYFVNGYFVRNDEQLLVIDPYYNAPSAKIGFLVTEDIVTPEEDESLYDNAIGSSNYSAPGAHRLKISLSLQKYSLTTQTDKNFIQLLRVKRGVIEKKVVQADYSLLEQTLARRTYDESGDYVVDNFSVDVREYAQKEGNNGVYAEDSEGNYNGLSEQEASEKMIANVGPGKAYIRGYEIVNKETKSIEISKARETLDTDNVTIKTRGLPTYFVSNVSGSTPLNAEGSDLTSYPDVELYNVYNDALLGQNLDFVAGQRFTEDSDERVSSIDRRGKLFTDSDAIKTLTVEISQQSLVSKLNPPNNAASTLVFTDVCDSNGNLYAVSTRASGLPEAYNSFKVIGFSIVNRPDASPGDQAKRFAEITLLGNKAQLDALIEYDAEDEGERRYLFLGTTTGAGQGPVATITRTNGTILAGQSSQTYSNVTGVTSANGVGAQFNIERDGTGAISSVTIADGGSGYTPTEVITILGSSIGGVDTTDDIEITVATIVPVEKLGYVVDYNESVTPLIGTTKPSNFTLKKKGFGFNADTDVVVSKGTLSNGQKAYNSIFGLSYFGPSFFTKIILESQPTAGFGPGDYIVGSTSGAYGVVEGSTQSSFSSSGILMVRTLSGKFKSGEVLKDENDNAAKIATENTISHFVTKYRSSGGYPQGTDITINGQKFDTSKITVTTDTGGIGYVTYVEIRDRAAFTQTYSQPPVVTVTAGLSNIALAARVDAVLFRDTVVTYSPQDVKSFGSAFGSLGVNKFTADVESNDTQYVNLVSVTEFTFSGKKGFKFLECNGFGGDATQFLKQGDYVQYTGTDGLSVRALVQYATKPEGTIKSRIYLDKAIPEEVVNGNIVKIVPKVDNFAQGTLIYPTGSGQVSAISRGSEDSKIKYYYRRDFVTTSTTSGNFITFTAQLPFGTQRFVTFDESNFIMTVLNPGDATNVKTGDVIYLTSENISTTNTTDQASGLNAGSVVITLPTSVFNSSTNFPKLKLSATLELTKARPRIKTAVKNKRILIKSFGDRIVPLRGENYDDESTVISSYADAFRVRYVYEGTSVAPPDVDTAGNLVGNGSDITERFTFDDGQRDTFYDVSRLVLKPGYPAPTGQLVVAFDYFEHSQGDFCTVDSYSHEAGVTLEEIPSFNSAVHGIVSLKNVLDFRPKVDASSFVTGFANVSSRQQPTTVFSGEGGVVSVTPSPDSNLEFTFSFSQSEFLNRIDGIFLNKKGQFVLKEGNSSQNPTRPEPLDDAIALYYIYVPAFTTTSKDVRITPVDNRRYTMKDIGKLEKRIERLEYYTTLSILEQQALGMQIRDEIGFDRFKTGFIVDNFETHLVGDISSADYLCAIDTQQSVLRCQTNEESFSLKEVNTRNDQRVIDGYQKTGDIVTLPYTTLPLLGNSFATKTINPNPFVALQYVGEGQLTPRIDPWYDKTVEPLIVDNNTQLYSIFISKNEIRDSFSSIFNSFIINWIGSKDASGEITSFGTTNSDSANSKVKSASVASSSNVSPQNNEIGKGLSTDSSDKGTVATSLRFFARSIAVKYVLRRLKPSTKLYPFLEGKDVSRWVNPDNRFTGIAGNSLSGFNGPIITDENGNASGLILIPGGYAPIQNATWTGNPETIEYDTTSEQVRVTTGIKTFRFTSSASNAAKEEIDTYAEVKYYAIGRLPENPATINSTSPSIFKANEGVQIIDSVTDVEARPNPLAQTFKIENYEGGCFATSVNLFFNKKSTNIPIRVYVTNTESDKPGKYIVPGTEVSLSPNTRIRVFTSGTLTVTVGETITGSRSNCSGPLLKVLDRNGNELTASSTGIVTLTNDQVYTFVLSNHNGKSFVQNEGLIIGSLTTYNSLNNTDLSVTIAKDSGKVSELLVKQTGSNYESAILSIESPQLPGGSVANGSVNISGGEIYNCDVTLFGSEYTAPPSIVVKGIGNGAAGAVIEAKVTIDTPAVRMGVAVDPAGVTQSITPTTFAFDYPVYLQNNSQYALVVETDSTEYALWTSRLGEIEIATSTPVTTQPLLGSVFRSQNVDTWTEDLFEDIKFTINRAEFDISRVGSLKVENESLGYQRLGVNPIQTDGTSNAGATSDLFRNNNKILRINHPNHGFEDRGNSYVFLRNAETVAGVTNTQLNTTLFRVKSAGVDYYHIENATVAANTLRGGGSSILVAHNKKYERMYPQVNYLTFSATKVETSVKSTNIVPVDSTTTNYVSYSQTGYEKTFLNEIHYFNNQKVLCSKINQTANNLDRSFELDIKLSSTVSYLSPVIDLSSASVKFACNRIEKSKGKEDRYGRRDQILKFKDVYYFALANLPVGEDIDADNNQAIEGYISKAKGTIIRKTVVGGTTNIWVKVSTTNGFQKNEGIIFGGTNSGASWDPTANQGAGGGVAVGSDPTREIFSVSVADTIVARNPSILSTTFDNKIDGKVQFFDSQNQIITLKNDKKPHGNLGYTESLLESSSSGNARSGEGVPDIFRVGDIIAYPDQPTETVGYWEIKEIEYTNGVEYRSENTFSDSSSIAKYVSKEISIGNPGTSIDVRLTVNVKNIDDVQVLYRYKKSSSQEAFDNIEWEYFNETGLPDIAEFPTSENSISGIVEKQSSYQELKYSVSNLPEFSSFGIKIVMRSVDPVYVPKIQDLRAVASY
jgi:hypothetical protein